MPQYHIRRSEKALTSPEDINGILKRCKWMTLALSAGNRPYAVAINYGHDPDRNCLYMHCATNGHKLDVIRHNTACCASIVEDLGYKYGKCDHAYRSLLIHGTVTLVLEKQEIRHGLEVLIRHLEPDPDPVMARFFHGSDDVPEVGILKLDIRHITGKESL
ncbi:MAG TPA: pyridoxamine 5'-phosphate oxidase family protein [bacterium]|nr:pyridoxamine 5'-phosphate oxidase family protein [bacterium]